MKENVWDSLPPEKEPERVAYLIAGFIRGTITETEHTELDRWVEASEANMRLFEELTDEDKLEEAQAWFALKQGQRKEKERALAQIKERAGVHRTAFKSRWLWAAAVVVVLFISGSILLTLIKNKPGTGPAERAQAIPGTLKPKGLVLTLANGQQKEVDPASNGMVGDGARVEKEGLVYADTGPKAAGFNTLSLPAGMQYKVVLPDGTAVWLNAESTLRYPTAFSGEERKVELSGEAYFEVTKDPHKPFSVITNRQRIQVLGTHFSVSAYDDEAVQTTTLVEGRVKVEAGLETKILDPGQQTVSRGEELKVQTADLEEALAWKEGLFFFRNAAIETVAGQLKHWYGVEIAYEGKVNSHLNGTLKRSEGLERLLAQLEETGFAHFSLEGNKVVIRP